MIFLTDIVDVDLTTTVKFSLVDGRNVLASCQAVEWEKPGAWLMHVHVHPDHRRQGYGQLLLKEVMHFARGKQKTGLGLAVRQINKPAIALYQSLGFVVCYADGQNLVMTIHLQAEKGGLQG